MIVKNGQQTGMIYMQGVPIGKIYANGVLCYEKVYINSGLVQHYDAINNTGSGHNIAATIWKDLAGSNDGVLHNGTWDNDSLKLDGNSRVSYTGTITPRYTIMCTMSAKHIPTRLHPRITDSGNNSNSRYPALYIYNNNATPEHPDQWGYRIYGHGVDLIFQPKVINVEDERVHIAYRFDNNGKVDLFINGILRGSRIVPSQANSITTTYLGGNNTTTRFLNGEICNFMRYDRALSDSEILNNAEIDKIKYNIQ